MKYRFGYTRFHYKGSFIIMGHMTHCDLSVNVLTHNTSHELRLLETNNSTARSLYVSQNITTLQDSLHLFYQSAYKHSLYYTLARTRVITYVRRWSQTYTSTTQMTIKFTWGQKWPTFWLTAPKCIFFDDNILSCNCIFPEICSIWSDWQYRLCAARPQATIHYLDQCRPSPLTHMHY